ncbi:MAG: hypothetical protein C0413_03825 [Clostridiales bacterium]|nr:hypothetical protein [Clostridiales bacterium]
MKSAVRYIVLIAFSATALLLLTGCSESARTKAISDAVVTYSDYYIEVRNLGDQVRAQSETIDSSAKSVDYVITVDIPDYTQIDLSATSFILPEPILSSQSANSYEKQASLALRFAMEQYAAQNGMDQYLELPVTFSMNTDGADWTANMTSQSKLDIQRTIEDMILGILQQLESYQRNYQRMQVSSSLSKLLTDVFGGKEYAKCIKVTGVALANDGVYTATFTYPDPVFVFTALGNAYIASYNQLFYGNERVVSLSIKGLNNINLTDAAQMTATVRVFYDEAMQSYVLLDDDRLSTIVAEARTQAEHNASAMVNSQWRVPPSAPPDNGSVIEGQSVGNRIVFKTGTSLGKYFYVRFYAISGEDISEEGTLQLGVFIVGGKSAKVKLPKGYYRVACVSGENWYGLEHLFGSDMKTYNGENAIQSRNGYINNISFE